MTAIAAIKENGKVWMGGDSAGVAGLSLQLRSDPKVFKNGEFLIGYTSSFRMGQLLRFQFHPPTANEGQDKFEYMIQKFIPEVRSCLKSHGFATVESGQESFGQFIVGWRGSLYFVDSDLQVAEMRTEYFACGCGQELALGSMFSTEGKQPKARIETALKAAEAFSAGVRGPFTILQA